MLPTAALPLAVNAVLAIALVAALGPLLYRLVYQPLAEASVLTLLIVSVALHLVLVGVALALFGPGGARSAPAPRSPRHAPRRPGHRPDRDDAGRDRPAHRRALPGFAQLALRKAMRAVAINRTGARLMGISAPLAGRLSFLIAGMIGALSGFSPPPRPRSCTTPGFLLGLKGFVGAILGGLASFPLAALGAVLVGLLEAYASFFASAYKEVIVFSLMVPILLVRTLRQAACTRTTTRRAPAAPVLDDGPEDLRRQALMQDVLTGAFVVAIAAAPFLLSDYSLAILDYVGLAALVALGLVLLTGVAG